jgi:hypothetical protein
LVAIAGHIIVLALYFFVFEMKASEVIIRSDSFERFKLSMRRLRMLTYAVMSLCIILDTLIQIII